MPSKLSPMLATPTDVPFNDKKWIFEIMWDGLRATCFLKDGSIELVNRAGDEITEHYDELAQIAGDISAETAVLDGEIVALDEKGVPGSQLNEPRAGRKGKRASTGRLTTVYYTFDIVHYDGYDLTKCKLEDRRALLQKILSVGDTLRFSDSVKGEGEQFFRLVEEKGLKGIVAKRVDSKYVQRRSRDWLKLKTDSSPQETEPEPSRPARVVQSKKPKNSSKEPLPASALLKRPLSGNIHVKIHGETLSLTNLDKVYFPDDGYTKGDVLRYYYEIASTLIPYYKDRPLIMKRYPNGINGHVFHQHNLEKPPAFVETYTREREPRKESVVYGLINNVESLLYIANLGAVSLHPWSSRPDTLELADWIIFDVDPGDATFHTVCDVALEVKKVLDEIGLEGFPKTSGSKGIHVFVPVKPKYTYDQVVPFANAVAALIARRRPDIVGIERMRVKRKEGRVYLDFLQNGFGKTVAGVYSLRARPGAPLSAPLEWAEVKAKKITPLSFTMQTIFKRLEKKGDLFKPVLTKRQTLDTAVAKLSKIFDRK
jgi:bifunctional non-homologous end joining protein LigD